MVCSTTRKPRQKCSEQCIQRLPGTVHDDKRGVAGGCAEPASFCTSNELAYDVGTLTSSATRRLGLSLLFPQLAGELHNPAILPLIRESRTCCATWCCWPWR